MNNRASIADLSPSAQRQALEQIRAQQPRKRSKYGNIRIVYKSIQGFERTYDSKGEADYAAMLDKGIQIDLIKWWIPQPIFPLPSGIRYRADFLVCWTDGRIAVVDVKSPITAKLGTYRMKKKLLQEMYGIAIEEAH